MPITSVDRDKLANNTLFKRLSDVQFERIVSQSVNVHLSQNSFLFAEGDLARRFYLLLDGQIKLSKTSKAGAEKVIEIVNPGQTFAEALMFLENPHYPVGAQAMRDTALISVSNSEFVSVLRESVDTLMMVAADLSQRLHSMVQELNDLSLHSGTRRVACFFCQRMNESGRTFSIGLPKQVIASRLSLKPETLSRIFRKLTDAAVIALVNDQVRVLDAEQLIDIADMDAFSTST